MSYGDKLKDPRWQKKRLEVLERDDFTCQKCCDTETTLNVHHRVYFKNKDPWDYLDTDLITLCEKCHNLEYGMDSICHDFMLELRRCFWTEDINNMMISLLESSRCGGFGYNSKVIAEGIGLILKEKSLAVLVQAVACSDLSKGGPIMADRLVSYLMRVMQCTDHLGKDIKKVLESEKE